MPILHLLGLPALFLALSDALAGYLLVRFLGAGAGSPRLLPFLLGGVACLVMSGQVWADVLRIEEDLQTRPERPIPSGMISLTTAYLLGAALAVGGLLLAMKAGLWAFLLGGGLLLLLLARDAGLERVEGIAPAVAGLTRAVAFLLGATAHPYAPLLLADRRLLVPPALLAIFCAAAHVLRKQAEEARRAPRPSASTSAEETGEEERVTALPVWTLGAAVIFLVPATALLLLPRPPFALLLYGALLGGLLLRLGPLLQRGAPPRPERLAGVLACASIGLNAAFVASLTSTAERELRIGTTVLFDRIACPTRLELAGVLLVGVLILPTVVLHRRLEHE